MEQHQLSFQTTSDHARLLHLARGALLHVRVLLQRGGPCTARSNLRFLLIHHTTTAMTTQAERAKRLGLSACRYRTLVQLSRQLHKWHVDECDGLIQYDEDDQQYYRYTTDSRGCPAKRVRSIPDLESAWLEEARRHATAAGCQVYLQTDPRGPSLYLYKQSDLDKGISACYSTVATPIY